MIRFTRPTHARHTVHCFANDLVQIAGRNFCSEVDSSVFWKRMNRNVVLNKRNFIRTFLSNSFQTRTLFVYAKF